MNATLKRKVMIALLVPVLGMPMALSSFAAHTDEHAAAQTTQRAKNMRNMRASQLIGKNVENAQGENLGEIKDLIVDVNNQRVYYTVLEFGGFLGMGEKLFAYPIRAFKHTGDNMDKLVLNVDQAKLKAAPGFARDTWPEWLTYREEVDRYYGPKAGVKAMPNQNLRRASELLGKDVNDRSGEDVGEIDDIVVNMNNGKIQYAVLEFDQSWNLNDKLIALPMRAFTYTADKGDLVLNVDKAKLDTKRAFDKDGWPNLNNRPYGDRYLISAPARTPEARFMRVDVNSDGMISEDEANRDRSVNRAWAKLDKDKDGQVSREDFMAYQWK